GDLWNLAGGVCRFGRRFDGAADGRVEAYDVAVEPFGGRAFQLPTHAEVERQLARRLPVVVEEEALINRLVRARGVAINEASGRDAQQERGELLAAGDSGRRVGLARKVVVEIITPGGMGRGYVVLAVGAEVVAHLKRMAAGDLRQRRLRRVDVKSGRVTP